MLFRSNTNIYGFPLSKKKRFRVGMVMDSRSTSIAFRVSNSSEGGRSIFNFWFFGEEESRGGGKR